MYQSTVLDAIGHAVPDQYATASPRVDPQCDLLAALQRRDPAACELLVARYGDRAYRLAIGITRDSRDAEEAVSDAFWSIVRKIDTFRGDAALGSWIYRVVANAAYQKVRRQAHRRDEIPLDEVLPAFDEDGCHAGPIQDWSTDVDDPAVQGRLREALQSALDELPPHYRAIFVLHDMEGVSMSEAATSLGITVSTAKTRAHRARLFLRKRLSAFMEHVAVTVA
jgi:RNA polymerase sigma-70 factor, ECF subfamily